MDFALNEEQRLLQKTVKEFCAREIESRAMEIDRLGMLPDDLITKMAGLHLLGMTIPVRYGGMGASHLDDVLVIEQLGYSGTGAWWLAAFCNSIPGSIVEFGTEEQRQRYLRAVCEGLIYPSIQFTETDTGSDSRDLKTTAKIREDICIINGMKRFSTFGARKGFAVLYAKDDSGNCTAFITDKLAEGYVATSLHPLMGGGGIEAVDVYYENMKLPKANLLGKWGEGQKILFSWIADEKIQQCGACLGIAQAALDEGVKYSKARRVGKKGQADLQGIQWMLADSYSRLEAARWLTYRTAFLRDQGTPSWAMEAAAAKLFVVPAAMEIVELSRRIHGAYGYSREFKIERLYRAISGASAIATSLEINKSIVSAALLKG